ncbi:Transferase [Macleaya cordata]|uniref:Transferase n=1 Tax=Macleaya cordata TaxID=56857 RepID=A0A200RCP0_MACCD|nr:Transferase [Macleaya cordata]
MEMKVEVVSKETIKPSSPTPLHLRIFNLSFLDQIAPTIYVPIVLFYTNDGDADDTKVTEASRLDVIKNSLSETLTRYYPLAGRIKDEDSLVECNDEGVDYLEAKVHNTRLFQHIQHPDVQVLKQFLPCQPYGSEYQSELYSKVLLAIQVNVFDCGGIVIGVCMSHKVADASSLSNFVYDWAATARGATEQIKGSPLLDLPTLFPKVDLMGFTRPSGIKNEELLVTKKFVFEGSKIAELKKTSGRIYDNIQEYPTRVEAVSAFIWKRFMDLDQAKEGVAASETRVYAGTQAVNIRARMVPPLSTNTFGNIYTTAVALSIIKNADDQGEKDSQYPILVGQIREAVKKIDSEHIRKLQSTDAYLNYMKQRAKIVSSGQASTVMFHFSSWCRFPLYEADFGWGKPTWVTTAPLPYENVVVLVDTKSGDGIEAWVNMTKEDMAEFERDKELLAFAS